MTVLIVTVLALVALGATVTVLTPDPARQAVTMAAYGLALAVLFMLLAAPDVALSEIGVEAAVVPLIIMLTIRKTRRSG